MGAAERGSVGVVEGRSGHQSSRCSVAEAEIQERRAVTGTRYAFGGNWFFGHSLRTIRARCLTYYVNIGRRPVLSIHCSFCHSLQKQYSTSFLATLLAVYQKVASSNFLLALSRDLASICNIRSRKVCQIWRRFGRNLSRLPTSPKRANDSFLSPSHFLVFSCMPVCICYQLAACLLHFLSFSPQLLDDGLRQRPCQ